MNMNNIVSQQIKDLQPRPIPFIQPSIQASIQPSIQPSIQAVKMMGMQELCYHRGMSAAQTNTDPSPVVDGLDAFPCTLSEINNQAYTQGFIDGLGL